MIPNTYQGVPQLPAQAFPARAPRLRVNLLALAALAIPTLAYVASLWVLRPFPFPYATPFLLLFAPFLIIVSRDHVIDCLFRLRFEFSLLLFMMLLSVLSLMNTDAPFRSFRIIFPCVIPFFLFSQLMVTGFVSRKWLLWVPRLLIITGILLSVAPFFVSYFVPPLKSYIFGEYRLKCFFEISIQHTIALAVLIPLIVTEFVLSRSLWIRLAIAVVMLLIAYTAFRAGSKTAMSVGFLGGLILFVTLKLRSQSLARTLGMFLGIFGTGVFLYFFGLNIAEILEPETAAKMRDILTGDLSSYHSMSDRLDLWRLAIEQGWQHWAVGSGPGQMLMGVPHAHNLVLDYFRGIGLFGATAIVLLCLTIFTRTISKGILILRGCQDEDEKRIFACYMAASIYTVCNQMSDCFGPSTIGLLWTVYLVGVLAERTKIRRQGPLPGPPSQDWNQRPFPTRSAVQ